MVSLYASMCSSRLAVPILMSSETFTLSMTLR